MMLYSKDNPERESLLPQPLCVGRQRSRRPPRSPRPPRSMLPQLDKNLHKIQQSTPLPPARNLHPLAKNPPPLDKEPPPLPKPLLHLDNKHLHFHLVNP